MNDYCTLSPDSCCSIRHTAACFIHDWNYVMQIGKLRSDRLLMDNLREIYAAQGVSDLGNTVGRLFFAGLNIGFSLISYFRYRLPWVNKNEEYFRLFADDRIDLLRIWKISGVGELNVIGTIALVPIIQKLIDSGHPNALHLAHKIIDQRIGLRRRFP